MEPIDGKEETAVIRDVSHDEEGKKRVEKTEVDTHNVDTFRYVERKLMDKGVMREQNYVDEEAEGRILRGEVSDVAAYVVGEVEVPKAEEVGVARIDVDPHLQVNLQ